MIPLSSKIALLNTLDSSFTTFCNSSHLSIPIIPRHSLPRGLPWLLPHGCTMWFSASGLASAFPDLGHLPHLAPPLSPSQAPDQWPQVHLNQFPWSSTSFWVITMNFSTWTPFMLFLCVPLQLIFINLGVLSWRHFYCFPHLLHGPNNGALWIFRKTEPGATRGDCLVKYVFFHCFFLGGGGLVFVCFSVKDKMSVSHSVMCDSLQSHGLYSPPGSSVEFSRQEYWSGFVLFFPQCHR